MSAVESVSPSILVNLSRSNAVNTMDGRLSSRFLSMSLKVTSSTMTLAVSTIARRTSLSSANILSHREADYLERCEPEFVALSKST